jgi:hypothetical protein
MIANPYHDKYHGCKGCGRGFYSTGRFKQHILEHIEHIIHVREEGNFADATASDIVTWISIFVKHSDIDAVVQFVRSRDPRVSIAGEAN